MDSKSYSSESDDESQSKDTVIVLDNRSSVKTPKRDGFYHWTIQDYQAKLERSFRDPTWSLKREFHSSGNQHKLQAIVFLNGTGSAKGRHLSIFLRAIDDQPDLHCRLTIMLKDQRADDEEQHHICWMDEPHFGSKMATEWLDGDWGPQAFARRELLKAGGRYVVNDTIILDMQVQPLNRISRHFVSNDGVLVWHVPNYSRLKLDERQGVTWCQYSEPFYSAPHGYRMKVQLFLNGYGDGLGTHLTVCLGVLEGKHDVDLPRLFNRRVSFTLVDRKSTDADLTKFYVVSEARLGATMVKSITGKFWGIHQFVSHKEIERDKSPYLEDDCIVLVVKVTTLD